jgi:D-sedoheptulose 7-phosphate isomerase
MNKMNVIIIAAGRGERMKPFTDNTNKTLFKVDGKPLLLHHVEKLIENGFDNIFVTCFWKADKILETLKEQNITLYVLDKLLDSGTAISQVIKDYKLDRTLIIYGDTYYVDYYYELMNYFYHRPENFIFSEVSDKYQSGFLKFKKYLFKITGIYEKIKPKKINDDELLGKQIGILILNNEIKGTGDIMTDLLPKYINKLTVLPIGANTLKWVDIGNMDRYIELTLQKYKSTHVHWLLRKYKKTTIKFIKKILFAKRIFIFGNGGSAATAQHLALDFSKAGGKKAFSFDSQAALTAYSNDDCYQNAFFDQLEKYDLSKNDIVLVISGSGNSPNMVCISCNYKDQVIAMTGPTGYLIENIPLTLPVNSRNIRVIEDAHLAYGHAITEILFGLT